MEYKMREFLGKAIFIITRKLLKLFRFSINLGSNTYSYPELRKTEEDFCALVFDKRLTLTSIESLKLLMITCKYIELNKIEGSFVETGVWRGGSSIIAKYILGNNRKFYLYDTYDGMTEPSDYDYRIGESTSSATVAKYRSLKTSTGSQWVAASLEEVKNNFKQLDLLDSSIHFLKGDIRITLKSKENLPSKISLLRIDTDFYDSTLISLEVMWPLLVKGGVLILDDYAHWDGARRAVDEYFGKNGLSNLLKIPIAGGGG